MQLPVVVLQASGVGSKAQGSEGTDRDTSLPRVTPLKPPDIKRWPSHSVMANNTERFTGCPMAETKKKNMNRISILFLATCLGYLEEVRVTWFYPGVTVDLVQRHRVTVVFCFCSPTNYNHCVFDQSSSMKETRGGLQNKKKRNKSECFSNS